MRFVAFPSSFHRLPLELDRLSSEIDGWQIVYSSETGLYIIEACPAAIEKLKEIYDDFYLFMEDF